MKRLTLALVGAFISGCSGEADMELIARENSLKHTTHSRVTENLHLTDATYCVDVMLTTLCDNRGKCTNQVSTIEAPCADAVEFDEKLENPQCTDN